MNPDDDLRRLGDSLETVRLGRPHEHHGVLDSTNDRAMAWAREGAPDGALVTADGQTAGRGRHGRSWSSPVGGDLYASVVVRPPVNASALGALGLAVAAGLREGLPPIAGLGLKWPNDVLVDGRKLAGILCETRWQGQRAEVVVGFGINVLRTEFPDDLRGVATSLSLELGRGELPGRVRVLADVLASLEAVLAEFFSGGFPAIRARYEPHLVMLGQAVRLTTANASTEVVAEALEHDGALRVRPVAGGSSYRVESADVWLRRG